MIPRRPPALILVDRVRSAIAPGKCDADRWLEVMAEAHQQGLMTTATMMFGSLDTVRDRVEHMRRLRELQEQSLALGRGYFTAFIPWPFQPANTALSRLPREELVRPANDLGFAARQRDVFYNPA